MHQAPSLVAERTGVACYETSFLVKTGRGLVRPDRKSNSGQSLFFHMNYS